MKIRLIALAIYIAFLALMFVALPAWGQGVDVQLCAVLELPGRDHTLNPYDPPARQRQERVRVCETVNMPDTGHHIEPLQPITDYRHDRRSKA